MKKIKLTENQLVTISKLITENDKGTVLVKKDNADPDLVKKYTDDGVNVSLVDEDVELNEDEFLANYFAGAETVDESMVASVSFNLETLKGIKSFKGRVDYCRKFLKRLGSGSSRIVFDYNDQYVIKLAKNRKGLAQNESENMIYDDYFDLLAEIVDKDTYSNHILYIVMEKAKPIKETEFEQLTEIDINDLWVVRRNSKNDNDFFDMAYNDLVFEKGKEFNQYLDDLQELHFGMGATLELADILHISSYGKVKRNGHDTVVLVDYGLTKDVWRTHYRRR